MRSSNCPEGVWTYDLVIPRGRGVRGGVEGRKKEICGIFEMALEDGG